jgi:hypothetical protein
MNPRCPVCEQELPQGLDEHTLRGRLQKLAAPEVAREARSQADRLVEAATRKILAQHQRELRRAELRTSREINQARKEAEKQAKHAAAQQNQNKLERLELERNMDRARHRREMDQMKRKLEEACSKAEKLTSDQLGDQAEVNLHAELRAEFPGDNIEQVRHGAKGADIIHDVMDGNKKMGRIIYESKNVSTWQNEFVNKAKRCQTQYNTPYVLIVTRMFPRRKRGLCIVRDIPVVEPRMAIALAAIIREGIAEIGRMRLSNTAREDKAADLFNYVLSDEFVTRFRQIRESVQSLREQQNKERDWHENAWQTHTKLYDQIDSRRRDIEERIKTITRDLRIQGNGRPRVAALIPD